MKNKLLMLPCFAVVAFISLWIGDNSLWIWNKHANDLLIQNVEVLSNSEGAYEYPGCAKKTERKASVQNRESIDVPEVIDSVFAQLVHNIEYLPLRGSETHIMPEASKIRFNNEHIYIWNKEQHCISVYSLDGGFLFSLDKRGKARGEYMEIASFTVDATNIYVVDNYKHCLYYPRIDPFVLV